MVPATDRGGSVDAAQLAAGGADQGSDFAFEVGDLAGQLEHPLQPAAGHPGPGGLVTGQQVLRGPEVGAVGQVGQLVVVAGPQPDQVEVDPVGQRGPFGDELVAVLCQQPQGTRSTAAGRPLLRSSAAPAAGTVRGR